VSVYKTGCYFGFDPYVNRCITLRAFLRFTYLLKVCDSQVVLPDYYIRYTTNVKRATGAIRWYLTFYVVFKAVFA
jgi:hypothetical protein